MKHTIAIKITKLIKETMIKLIIKMSTKYFLLTKNNDDEISNNDNDQLFFINKSRSYILPYNNLNYYNSYGLFENGIITWCRQFCSNQGVFLDIGAHTGTYSISLANSCKKVYAFEPQLMTYYALCGSVALSNLYNIKCVPLALGSSDQVGKISLNIRSNDGGGSSVCQLNPSEIIGKEEIDIQTLDAFWMNIDESISFIKLDVEYNELNVLKGGINTLIKNNYPTILFEANHDDIKKNDLIAFLEQTLSYTVVVVNGTSNMFLAVKK